MVYDASGDLMLKFIHTISLNSEDRYYIKINLIYHILSFSNPMILYIPNMRQFVV